MHRVRSWTAAASRGCRMAGGAQGLQSPRRSEPVRLLAVLLTCMLCMVSRSCSSWWAELRASRRMSVSFISFSHSSDRSSDTSFFSGSPSPWAWKSLGQGRDSLARVQGRNLQPSQPAHPGPTYSAVSMPTEEDVEDLMEGEAVSVDPCCSLGEEGADESGVAISSMSE